MRYGKLGADKEVLATNRPKPIDVSLLLKAGSKTQQQPIRPEIPQHYPDHDPKALVN
jgi:hypothetical protein